MKQSLNAYFWQDTETKELGLTPEFFKTYGVIWQIMPKRMKLVQGENFVNIESSKWLGPLKAPINGVIAYWKPDVLEHPENLYDNPTLCVLK